MFSITTILIALTAIVSIMGFGQPSFLEKALFRPFNISNSKEYWRWVSGGFVHADYFHLFLNMLTLYFFGSNLEYYLANSFGTNGLVLYVLLYLSAIPISSMYSFYKHKNNFGYSALGASGAVAAVLFGSILFAPLSGITLYFAITIPAWLFGILYLVYEYYMGKKQMDNIGHDAHFYGALYGILFVIMVKPSVVSSFIMQLKEAF